MVDYTQSYRERKLAMGLETARLARDDAEELVRQEGEHKALLIANEVLDTVAVGSTSWLLWSFIRVWVPVVADILEAEEVAS